MSDTIKYILIQTGYCVFGSGHTYSECLADASQWLEPNENGSYTPARIELELLSSAHKYHGAEGGFQVLEAGDEGFDSYLESQGGFYRNSEGDWEAE